MPGEGGTVSAEDFRVVFNDQVEKQKLNVFLEEVNVTADSVLEGHEVQCGTGPQKFTTEVFSDLGVNLTVLTTDEVLAVEETFWKTYANLAYQLCDGNFRTIEEVQLNVGSSKDLFPGVGPMTRQLQESSNSFRNNTTNSSIHSNSTIASYESAVNGTTDVLTALNASQTATNQSEAALPSPNTFALFMIRGRCRNCPIEINGVFNLFNSTSGQQSQRRASSVSWTQSWWRRNMAEDVNTCVCPHGLEPGVEPAVSVQEFLEEFLGRINEAKNDGATISVEDIITIIEVSSWNGRTTSLTLPPTPLPTEQPTTTVISLPESDNPGSQAQEISYPISTATPQACESQIVLLQEETEWTLSTNDGRVSRVATTLNNPSQHSATVTYVEVSLNLYEIDAWAVGDRFFVDIMGSMKYFEDLQPANSTGSLSIVDGTAISWASESASLGIRGERQRVQFIVPPTLFSSGTLSLEFGMVSSTTSSASTGVDGLVISAFYDCSATDPMADNLERDITSVPRTAEPSAIPLTTSPTNVPTPQPTFGPSMSPSTKNPTLDPTVIPTKLPTLLPTKNPTLSATPEPTEEPTLEPSPEPTLKPTSQPTPQPTSMPSLPPSLSPSSEPSSSNPSPIPSVTPSTSLSGIACSLQFATVEAIYYVIFAQDAVGASDLDMEDSFTYADAALEKEACDPVVVDAAVQGRMNQRRLQDQCCKN
ncbi:ECF subfamily RNA polymerase sigma-24 subunit [Seminavis robusta]|uniref:ECF subfamily RNA polymerase sigma-24 subunit n=1 Tax=Seminavis robusta TaxID=568900 RepID=A0A9N8HX72_9STRA|nr:ECF subfamily RNA polymerase sigma-24 subunit [Seminavis robusta]|eukprot:Sro1762_g295970.1 ECF subfamily RNA polymerase sigma-24 subunit (706) ;mRNA; r:10443-13308